MSICTKSLIFLSVILKWSAAFFNLFPLQEEQVTSSIKPFAQRFIEVLSALLYWLSIKAIIPSKSIL